jgi:hypothetical protein
MYDTKRRRKARVFKSHKLFNKSSSWQMIQAIKLKTEKRPKKHDLTQQDLRWLLSKLLIERLLKKEIINFTL